MIEPSLSALTSVLRPLVTKVFNHAHRLSAERQASQVPLKQPSSIMDESLNETLNRIRGGQIDSGWWKNLLDHIEHPFIAPDFLSRPALQGWLHDDSVANDLKTIAAWRIMETDEDEDAHRDRLAKSYANKTGEASYLATGPVDVVVAIMVAGYIASIRPDQRPIAAMIQEVSFRIDDRFDRLNQSISSITDPITRKTHTDYAAKELAQILTLRAFDPTKARTEIQKLHDRLDTGDLSAADNETRNSVRYWLARLCAGDANSLEVAKKWRAQLKYGNAEADLSIVDALIHLTDGDPDTAIQALRDHDDPDSRSILFVLLLRSRETDIALDVFDDKTRNFGARCFTTFGWRSWTCSMAEAGRWEEAAQRLAGFDEPWSDTPALAFFEGVINAQLLLPEDNRHSTSGPPLFGGITPNQGTQVEQAHERANACLELAKSGLDDIGVPGIPIG